MDITKFVGARLDEAQRIAEAAKPGPWRADAGSLYVRNGEDWEQVGDVWTVPDGADEDYPGDDATAEHIARHDPARVLADIAAKRRILERHRSFDFPANEDDGPGDYAWTPECEYCFKAWPCPELRDLAAPYAEHPDFRPDWKAEG